MNTKETKKEIVSPTPKTVIFPPPGCPGCQHPTIGRIIAEVLDEMDIADNVIGVAGIGCNAGAIALLNEATAIKRLCPDAIVFTIQGDGDCISIGAGPFIGALTRGEKITIIMCNNANYGTTGGQQAPTTLINQVTTTTSDGRKAATGGYPAHTAELAAVFKGVAYSARAAVNNPANYQRTKKCVKKAFKKQMDGVGLSFVEILSACPPNWHMSPAESLKWINEEMLAEFPLGEFKDVDQIV
jgi:2-oxoglutarate ferredoxin oxidoreductase subunit beta